MKICLLVPVLDAFKGGNHLPLLSALPETEFTILTNRQKPADIALPNNIRVETLGARLGPYYYGVADALFASAVLRKYPAQDLFWKQFDAIHLNQTMGSALLKLRGSGVPVCFFVHHPVAEDRRVALEESSGLGRLLWQMKYALLVRQQGRFCRAMPHVATVSQTSADRIRAAYGRTGPVSIVPNGVDTDTFVPGDLRKTDHDVVAIGSFIHPRKGFRYLLEAYRSLAAKGLRIADVGRRSAEQQAQLKAIPGITVFGGVSDEQLVAILQKSSCLISTSLYEGFGLSLVEALACGRPAFAFDGGAVGEVLRPVDPSLIVPLRDTKALVERVAAFLALPLDERVRKGEHYRKDVVARYPMAKAAAALRALYRDAAAISG